MKKIYLFIITILTTIVVSRYTYLYVFKHDYYYNKYLQVSNKIVYGLNAPRGRILDRNGKVLVDNIGVNTIVFHHLDNIKVKDIAIILNNIIEENSSRNIYLRYFKQNPVGKLYERLGFEIVEEMPYHFKMVLKRNC